MSLKLAPPLAESQPSVKTDDDANPDERGFRAQLDNLNLWDLVQMECLSGTRKSVLIRSAGRIGYLFFEEGQLVHALLDKRVGDAAALGMLAWESGEVVACEVAWPRARTVQSPWQSLLMQAAQQRDHRHRPDPDAFPTRNSGVLVIDSLPEERPPEPAGRFAEVACQRRARLDARGEVVALEGPDTEFAGRCWYAMRLAHLLGDALALGSLSALEVRAGASTVFAYREQDGSATALEPAQARDCALVRKQLEL